MPAVAIFWIDAEDHDWNEVRACSVFDSALTPRSIALPARTTGDASPVARIALDDSINAALDELEAILPPTEFPPSLMQDLRDAYAAGRGVADAFGRWLERVLGPRGLVVYDASDPASKPAREPGVRVGTLDARRNRASGGSCRGSPCIERLSLAMHARTTMAWRCSIWQMAGARFANTTDSSPSGNAACRRQPGAGSRRDAVGLQSKRAAAPDRAGHALPDDLLRGRPERARLSRPASRRLRPLRRRHAADVSARLRHAGRRGSHALPGQKCRLPLEALSACRTNSRSISCSNRRFPGSGSVLQRRIGFVPSRCSHSSTRFQRSTRRSRGAARSTLGRMQHDLQTLHGKMIHAAKKRDETLRRQFIRTRALAFPDGHAQERTIGFVSF